MEILGNIILTILSICILCWAVQIILAIFYAILIGIAWIIELGLKYGLQILGIGALIYIVCHI